GGGACRLTIWLASSVVIVGGLVFEDRLRPLADIKDPVGTADTCVLLDVGPRCRRATDDLQAAIGHVGTSKFAILGLLLGTDGSPAMTQLRLRSSRTRASGSGLKAQGGEQSPVPRLLLFPLRIFPMPMFVPGSETKIPPKVNVPLSVLSFTHPPVVPIHRPTAPCPLMLTDFTDALEAVIAMTG